MGGTHVGEFSARKCTYFLGHYRSGTKGCLMHAKDRPEWTWMGMNQVYEKFDTMERRVEKKIEPY